MNDVQTRALRALGYTYWGGDGNNAPVWEKEGCPKLYESAVDEDKLIGMLLEELNKRTDGDLAYYGLNHYVGGGRQVVILPNDAVVECESPSLLEALTAAVEAVKDSK